MILFPNAKINLGLQITGKRPDGYHNISTIMLPVGWCDVLEIVPTDEPKTHLTVYGNKIECAEEDNLVIKAYNALFAFMGGLPPVNLFLQKNIPDGAGLGGGSADASFTIRGLNELFNLGLSNNILADIAKQIGADCPFFIYNKPALCSGIGDQFDFDVNINLADKFILIIKPFTSAVSTKEAYANVNIGQSQNLAEIIQTDISHWKNILSNDFEKTIFKKLPILNQIKQSLYSLGALYASMSGSGSALYAIYDDDKLARKAYDNFSDCDRTITKIMG